MVRQNERGMALLLVLVIVTLLSSLVIEFSFSTLVDLRSTETFRDRTKAYYLSRGGIEAARTILQEDKNSFDHPDEFWGQPLVNIPVGDGSISIAIEDLSGRLNVNSVADERGNPLAGYHRFVALCEEVLQLNKEDAQQLADSLVYWYNSDKTIVTPDDEYYADLTPPYSRRGKKLTILDELRLVRGFDQDRFERLSPYLRVVGDNQINVNTAPPQVLYAWQFSASADHIEIILDRNDITAIVDYRRQAPFQTLDDLSLVAGIEDRWRAAWLSKSIDVKGTVYHISSQGRMNQVDRQAQAIVRKQGNQLLSFKVE